MLEKLSLFVPSPRLNEMLILKEVTGEPDITQAEIGRRCHLSVAMVNNYMKSLVSKGYLEYEAKSKKVIRYIITRAGFNHAHEVLQELRSEVASLYEQVVAAKETAAASFAVAAL